MWGKFKYIGIIIALLFLISSFTSVSISKTIIKKDPEKPEITLQDGWPQQTTANIHSSPVTADLNGDGKKEIIVGSGFDGSIFNFYVFYSNGTIMKGWPKPLTGAIQGSPAVGDLDNDGDLEIVIGDNNGIVYAWHHDGTLLYKWSDSLNYLTASPTLYDLDGDNDLEIIIGGNYHFQSKSYARVNIWHHDGTNMDGWPQIITTYHSSYIGYSSTAVGDIDGDGDIEIVVGVRTSQDDGNLGAVYAWHHDGQLVDGWPITEDEPSFYNIVCTPSLCDLDCDQDLEIFIGTGKGHILVLHHDGSFVSGWPVDSYSSPMGLAIADIDQDGKLEIINGEHDIFVYAWNDDGSPMDGWPQHTNGFTMESPIIGDIAGDEHLEIIAPSEKIYAWYTNGTIVPGFPIQDGIASTPCLDDIDGDGDIEIIAGSTDKKIFVWDLSHPYKPEGMEWPMDQHDLYHTGCYNFGKGFTVDANGPYYHMIYGEIQFTPSTINGKPPFIYRWDFGDGKTSDEKNPTHKYGEIGSYIVNLTVTDSTGKKSSDEDNVNISIFGYKEDGALNIKSIKTGMGIFAVIENQGVNYAKNVKWSIETHNYFGDEEDIIIPRENQRAGKKNIPPKSSRTIYCPFFSRNAFITLEITVTASIEKSKVTQTIEKNGLLFYVY